MIMNLDDIMQAAGALRWGVAEAAQVDPEAWQRRERWLRDGNHASMDYLARYPEVRRDPRNLLDGARSIIVAAFNYFPATRQSGDAPQFAWYAYGRDYHEVVRNCLEQVVESLSAQNPDAAFRICVDTAPLMERYWAVKAGIGFVGRNAQLIVPGHGSACFLGEIVTTLRLQPSDPCTLSCPEGCDRCIRACPGKAIAGDSTIDARCCLSYLTIEHRGPLPDDAPDPGRRIYGCDTCQSVCPLNAGALPTDIDEFRPSDSFLSLRDNDIASMTPDGFSRIFSHSAVKRAKLAGLLRNLAAMRPR